MKDSQHIETYYNKSFKYIKANNERFSTRATRGLEVR